MHVAFVSLALATPRRGTPYGNCRMVMALEQSSTGD
jgi:hypothetical protein